MTKVAELIDPNPISGTWDEEFVVQTFLPQDA
jgi:hypothetical protein